MRGATVISVEQRTKLLAFTPSDYHVSATVSVSAAIVNIHYQVAGSLHLLLNAKSGREQSIFRNELWRSTCFELFLEKAGQYLEWNFALSGAYACYYFSGYRPQVGELRGSPPRIACRQSDELLQCSVSFRVPAALPAEGDDLRIQVSAVLQTESGCSYFALRHPAQRPDFHCIESFQSISQLATAPIGPAI